MRSVPLGANRRTWIDLSSISRDNCSKRKKERSECGWIGVGGVSERRGKCSKEGEGELFIGYSLSSFLFVSVLSCPMNVYLIATGNVMRGSKGGEGK